MSHSLKKLIVFILLAYFLCFDCFAQVESNKRTELLIELTENEKLVAECEQKAREFQLAKFGKVLPKLSGHCWDGCPTNVVLPYYPRKAKRLKISGQVKVETIVDESGSVIHARIVKGLLYLSQAAERAASRSSYQPKKTCNGKPIKFRWTITYNFILD